MATTEEILEKAGELGTLVSDHDATQKLKSAAEKLDSDKDAQQALAEYNRAMQELAQKEMQGLPIEVADKHRLESLQQAVIHNLTLKQFMMAQVDHTDLVRKIDSAIHGEGPLGAGAAGAGGGSPLVGPGG